MRTRIIGIGQHAAGDDGVGRAVLAELVRRGVPPGVELVRAADPSELIDLLDTPVPVVLVDALLGGTPGKVKTLTADELARRSRPLSSHGVDVPAAIELARLLGRHRSAPDIRIVAISIPPAMRFSIGLSPEIAGAVGRAADLVLGLVEERD